jgi:hypothetical protein
MCNYVRWLLYYGVEYDEWEGHYGVPKRAVFLVDPHWTVGFSWTTGNAFGQPDPSPVDRGAGPIEERIPGADRRRLSSTSKGAERRCEAASVGLHGRTDQCPALAGFLDGRYRYLKMRIKL